MRYMTMGLRRKVSLALLPIDDVTGRVVTGSAVRMYTLDGKKPSIRKEEGYHVFCDLEGEQVQICAEGPLYQKQTITVPLGEEPVVRQVRMLPGRSYPIPAGATCLKGELSPGSRIRLFFPDQKKGFKLLYDYEPEKEGRRLRLYCPEKTRLDGRLLCIAGKKGAPEFFRIARWQDEEGELEAPLSQAYKKIGTTVFPVYEAVAGEDGSFYLLIRSLPEDGRASVFLRPGEDGEKEIGAELVFKAGRENRITQELLTGRRGG